MKKKILTLISFVLVFCQLLPVCTGAVDTLDVYPIIYMYPALSDQADSSSYPQLHTYQTTSESTTFRFTKGPSFAPDSSTDFEHGVLFPINNITNIEGGTETYLVNFTMQIKPLRSVAGGTFDPDEFTLDLLSFYTNYGTNGEIQSFPVLSRANNYSYHTSSFNAYYKWIYTPYINSNDLNDDRELYYGVYTLHFTLLLDLDYSSPLNNLFFQINFYDLCSRFSEIDFIIQPCQTISYVVSDLDDIDSELSEISDCIAYIYALLGDLYESQNVSAGFNNSINSIVSSILEQDQIGYEAIRKATDDVKKQVQEMQDTMDEKVEQGLESFKENIKQEVEAEVDKAIKDIMSKVDVVDTSAAQDAFTTLYNVITTDSKNAVLTVPAFKLDLFGSQYVLWDSFTFDIPALVETMGADQYLFWFRFTFFFGFGWFLYGRANRMISIILLDDVHEQQANIRSEQQEYWRRRNGKR